MRPHGSPEKLERRRRRAIGLLREGYAPVQVARRLGVDRRSVRRWSAAYRRKGDRGIEAVAAPGRPSKLSQVQKQEIQEALLEGAQAAGFATDLWTCPRVAELIYQRCGVRYHVDHIGRLLHSFGWTPQKPQRKAAERDEEAIQGWVSRQWPRIKKRAPV